MNIYWLFIFSTFLIAFLSDFKKTQLEFTQQGVQALVVPDNVGLYCDGRHDARCSHTLPTGVLG